MRDRKRLSCNDRIRFGTLEMGLKMQSNVIKEKHQNVNYSNKAIVNLNVHKPNKYIMRRTGELLNV